MGDRGRFRIVSEWQEQRLWDWLWRLVRFGVIELYDYDLALGRAYGYKDCCIKNFLNLTKLGFYPAKWMWENIDERLLYDIRISHVPCIMCLEKIYEVT